MTDEIKAQLEEIAKQLNGVIQYRSHLSPKTTHEEVVITYDVKQRR
jgi:hypothetical protein